MPHRMRYPIGLRVMFSISLALGLLVMLPVTFRTQAAPSAGSPGTPKLPSTYITTTIRLATGVPRWPRAMAVDALGLVYLADGERGTVSVVSGPTFVDVISVGQEVADVAVDTSAEFTYASAPDPYALYEGHIAIIHGGGVVARVSASGRPGVLAADSLHNRVYAGVSTEAPFSDQIAILQRDRLTGFPNVPPGIVALDVDTERDRAYVVSHAAGGGLSPNLSIINGLTKMNMGVVQLDQMGVPRDVAVEPTTGLVYVVGQTAHDGAGTVLVISGTQQIASPLTVGADPRHLAVDPQQGRIYVTNAGDDTVTVIAGTDVVDTISVGPTPDAIAVDPARDRVYVSNTGDGTTTVLSSHGAVTTLPAGGGTLTVDTERGIAYLAGNGLAVAQHDSLLPSRPPTAAMPSRLAVNPETGLGYVCNQGTGTSDVFRATEVITSLSLSSTPWDVATDPVSGWIYVGQEAGLTVLHDATAQATLSMSARDVAVDPGRGLAYVAGDDGVAVISGTDHVATIHLVSAPRSVAVNHANGYIYASAGGQPDGFVAIMSGMQRVSTVTTGATPGKLVVGGEQDRVFVLHPAQGRLSVIEGSRRRFPNIFLPRPALDAALSPRTGDLYVATRGPLVLIRRGSQQPIDLGIKALSVAYDVKRDLAYATTQDDHIAVLHDADVVAMLPAGHRPVNLAIDSESGRVFVANYGSDTITVLDRQRPPDVYLPLIRLGAGE
ncbi:MAG: hypothetical protein MAG451_02643 [Anaerolineales bacterium]|nr:hypothetical protein [Anaerolineales bacterium]